MNDEITELMQRAYMEADDAGEVAISARDLARRVYSWMDPDESVHVLIRACAQNDLRRRAESVLRARHKQEESDRESGQVDAFELQSRYPCERAGVLCYVPPPHMTPEEGEICVERLRKEGRAKLAHADALEAYFAGRNS